MAITAASSSFPFVYDKLIDGIIALIRDDTCYSCCYCTVGSMRMGRIVAKKMSRVGYLIREF